ncbi:hypothetical protein D9M72_559020 [compost metagenome]
MSNAGVRERREHLTIAVGNQNAFPVDGIGRDVETARLGLIHYGRIPQNDVHLTRAKRIEPCGEVTYGRDGQRIELHRGWIPIVGIATIDILPARHRSIRIQDIGTGANRAGPRIRCIYTCRARHRACSRRKILDQRRIG